MHTVTISGKKGCDLKESREGYIKRFGGRNGVVGMFLNYNHKLFKLIFRKLMILSK